MRTLRTIAEVRAHVAKARRAGRSVGLVPTMGAFHAGHEALMRAAREACDEVVVSLFVNPAQFDERADLDAYPRTEASDAAVAAALSVDALFAPPVGEIYPDGFATSIRVAGLSDVLEGAERGASHFDGVCTVVAKLFNIVAPDVAFFGHKDAQQVVVIRRMVRDLDIPVRIETVPTVREHDGLALSSRNARLGAADRERALALRRGLDAVRAAIDAGEPDPARARAAGLAAMRASGVEPEYLTVVDPDTLEPVERVDGRVLAVVAARVGPARLIDNDLIEQVATRAAPLDGSAVVGRG
jgi:pantoate--beta-alanine ligase